MLGGTLHELEAILVKRTAGVNSIGAMGHGLLPRRDPVDRNDRLNRAAGRSFAKCVFPYGGLQATGCYSMQHKTATSCSKRDRFRTKNRSISEACRSTVP